MISLAVPVIEFNFCPPLEDILYLSHLAQLTLESTVQAAQLLVQLDPDI